MSSDTDGGIRCLEKHGKEHYQRMGRLSAEKRVKKLSLADVAYAAARRARGEHVRSIAASFGVSAQTVYRAFGRGPRRAKMLTPADEAQARTRHGRGETVASIALSLKVSRRTIYRALVAG